MVEKITNGITYTTSDGRRLTITSDMSVAETARIQGEYWVSWSRKFHPRFIPPHETSTKQYLKPKSH
jgi:hypothetical protein